VQVGTKLRPRSLETGSMVFATTWVFDWGNLLGTAIEGGVPSRLKTSNGPVKSSWVIPGKITKPTLKSDKLHTPQMYRTPPKARWRLSRLLTMSATGQRCRLANPCSRKISLKRLSNEIFHGPGSQALINVDNFHGELPDNCTGRFRVARIFFSTKA
jgi:hypothetical protein